MFKHVLVSLLIAMTATASIAHAQQKKGTNGGMVITSQGHPIEFVAKGQDLVFYINDDDDSPLSTKAMRGRATVQDSGKTTTVPLEPAAPNMMIGKSQAPLGAQARVVLPANLHGHALHARSVTE